MKESTVERGKTFQNQVEEKHVDNQGSTGEQGRKKKKDLNTESYSVKTANIFIMSAAD